MNRWFWRTAVALIMLVITAVGCGSSTEEPAALPEVAGPAFVLFYTDN
ncbi:hypothetical protein [Candidatus Leptofilum sp.]